MGSDLFVSEVSAARLEEESRLWEALSWVPDVQCAWQILLQCVGPRCHHFLRTVPPRQSAHYAHEHDAGMWRALEGVLGRLPGEPRQREMAHLLSTLPMRLGGLGLRSATRTAPAAYWASWADALEMLSKRLPALTDQILAELAAHPTGDGLAELSMDAIFLEQSGFISRPTWVQLRGGERPPPPVSSEPGEWQHGWQYHASTPLEHHFRETVIIVQSDAAEQAHMRSHAGPGASEVLCGAPVATEFRVEPHLFRALVLERLRLPLDVTEAVCECGSRLDVLGRHRAACPRSGRLRSRAVGIERSLARVCREAGATVRCNTKLRDMNICVPANDERAIEVLASGLPLHHGAQLAVDITLRSALTAQGCACPNASRSNGAVLSRARQDKETKYYELVSSERCQLVVVAIETGGRWSSEALDFVSSLAGCRARDAPQPLRGSAFHFWRRRWIRMLSVSCGRAFASSLISARAEIPDGQDGYAPDLVELFASV